ncbi:GntR family transcriptional regulator [Primorskyibacter sp. S187A]|uniref:GntR family transcriptional regulator n=1 Tax=Primorskyibacter sp. S187A TaxID=3415130 RepID=UPI003C7CD77F
MTALPRHLQISEMLVREIKAGVRLEGDRLPPERDFAKELGVSVGTLRKALQDLAVKGMLERVQGSGNYVRNNPAVSNIYALFRLELASGGGLPTAELIAVDRLMLSPDIPRIDEAPYAFRFRRIRSLDGIQIAAEEIWLGGARAQQVNASEVSDSLYQFYANRLGFRITRVEDRVTTAPLTGWALPYFADLSYPSWGYIERFSRDENDTLAEFSRTWFDPQRARFVAR